MKILVDENIPRMTVEGLRALSHEVKDVRGTAQQAADDSVLWQIATVEGRLLITTDKGFTAYRTVPHHGILVVRLRKPNRHKINSAVMLALQRFREAEWPGLIVVVRDKTMSTIRI
jgi:predicted nuclease of predicted toxin-antitoxin system